MMGLGSFLRRESLACDGGARSDGSSVAGNGVVMGMGMGMRMARRIWKLVLGLVVRMVLDCGIWTIKRPTLVSFRKKTRMITIIYPRTKNNNSNKNKNKNKKR